MNPGLGKSGFHKCERCFVIDGDKIKDMEIIEMENGRSSFFLILIGT
jgi:hypothetical protein